VEYQDQDCALKHNLLTIRLIIEYLGNLLWPVKRLAAKKGEWLTIVIFFDTLRMGK